MTFMDHGDDYFEAERLHRAAEDGDIAEMERLIEAGYSIGRFDDLSYTPLHRAVEKEQYKAALWLLKHGAEVNTNEEDRIGETALCIGVRGHYPEIVELLLQHGANPDISGWMGLTATRRARDRKDEEGKKICELVERYRRKREGGWRGDFTERS
jgi:ankyrin repeat protein